MDDSSGVMSPKKLKKIRERSTLTEEDDDYIATVETCLEVEGDVAEAGGCVEMEKDPDNLEVHKKKYIEWQKDLVGVKILIAENGMGEEGPYDEQLLLNGDPMGLNIDGLNMINISAPG